MFCELQGNIFFALLPRQSIKQTLSGSNRIRNSGVQIDLCIVSGISIGWKPEVSFQLLIYRDKPIR
jgi:hypothetical protein